MLLDAFATALKLIASLDASLVEVVALSLQVSFTALLISCAIGMPLGGALGVFRFPGSRSLAVLFNTLMGLPPVVAGLLIFLLLSRSGPLGPLGLLFTPTAMVIVQVVLITPIVASLTREVIEALWAEYEEQLRSLGASPGRALWTLLWDGRVRLVTVTLAGFGRAIAEVGGVIIVGGNIAHVTRVMTTSIVLETSKGNFALAVGLGIILLLISVIVNGLAYALRGAAGDGA